MGSFVSNRHLERVVVDIDPLSDEEMTNIYTLLSDKLCVDLCKVLEVSVIVFKNYLLVYLVYLWIL